MANVILRKRGEERPKKIVAPTATIGPNFRAKIISFRQPTATETFRALNALVPSRPNHATASC